MPRTIEYEQLRNVQKELEIVRETCERIEARVIEQNGRVRALEVWRGVLTGGLIVFGFVLGFISVRFVPLIGGG